jgi:hypothetical protein
VFSGEDGEQEPRCWSSGVLFRQPSCQNEDNHELDLRSHDPLTLSKAVYGRGWRNLRFIRKLFSGLGFAVTAIALRCFGFCPCCDRGQGYCSAECRGHARRRQRRAANRRHQQSVEGRLDHRDRQRAYRCRRPRRRVTDQGSQTVDSTPPSESGRAVTTPARTPLRFGRANGPAFGCVAWSAAGLAASSILFRAPLLAGELR